MLFLVFLCNISQESFLLKKRAQIIWHICVKNRTMQSQTLMRNTPGIKIEHKNWGFYINEQEKKMWFFEWPRKRLQTFYENLSRYKLYFGFSFFFILELLIRYCFMLFSVFSTCCISNKAFFSQKRIHVIQQLYRKTQKYRLKLCDMLVIIRV